MRLTCCLLVFYILFVTACDISIPSPETAEEPVIVANSLFSPDSNWQVHLTKSFTLYQAGQVEMIRDAVVEIKHLDDGIITKLTHQQGGIYTASENLPTANKKYELTVQVEKLKSVQAVNQIPAPFVATVENYQLTNYRNLPSYLFQLQILDNSQEENFYLIDVIYYFEKSDSLFQEKATHFSLDLNSDNELIVIDHTALRQSYLRDTKFNGQTYLTEFGASTFTLNQLTEIDHLTAIITIKSISKAGYQNAKTVEEFERSGDFSSPEPINIFSNVEHGFGIFAGFTEQRIEVQIK